MIELFTRRLDTLILPLDAEFTRISIDESIVSLSAILLNDVYYDLLKNGKKVLDGFSVIDFEALILFKLKAYLDLKERKKERKANHQPVDSKNIRKHKNDIFRLLQYVSPVQTFKIVDEIKVDVQSFIAQIYEDKPDLKNLGIVKSDFESLLDVLRRLYLSTSEG